jgi:hypothetical protein
MKNYTIIIKIKKVRIGCFYCRIGSRQRAIGLGRRVNSINYVLKKEEIALGASGVWP